MPRRIGYFVIVCQCGEYENYSHCISMIVKILCQWLLPCFTFISCPQFCLSDTCTSHLCNTNCHYEICNRLMVLVDGLIGIFHWHNPAGRTMAPGFDSVSNRNEYQDYFLGGKGGRCVGLTTLPPSCANYLEILDPEQHGTLWAF